jgi:hypothetical protein
VEYGTRKTKKLAECHTSIDTEADWTKSGWHGWVYGWKLHLALTVSSVWIPLSACLTPADVADNQIAPGLIEELPEEARFVLGDTHYDAENVHEICEQTQRFLVASKRGAYPHTEAGVEVRRIFHKLRSLANENFNEHFRSIFDVHEQVPTKGKLNTGRFVLGVVFSLPAGDALSARAAVRGQPRAKSLPQTRLSNYVQVSISSARCLQSKNRSRGSGTLEERRPRSLSSNALPPDHD